MQGILMKTDMIQAITEGRKTQTRRLIKPQPVFEIWSASCGVWRYKGKAYDNMYDIPSRYHVGETVYIKEAWSDIYCRGQDQANVLYALDYPPAPKGFKWQSPLFMPEWAARHFIFIEAVRAERLQEISWADCLAEGIIQRGDDFICKCAYSVPQGAFIELWDSVNPKHPWENNDWVQRYQFRLI